MAGVAETPYTIERSLRFRTYAQTKLTRTPSTATNRTTWTVSLWVKRGGLHGTTNMLWGCIAAPTDYTLLWFDTSNRLSYHYYSGGATVGFKQTTAIYRDDSAWLHIVAVWDTTNVTASDRMRLYVNGTRITALNASTDPPLNQLSHVNYNIAHGIGHDTIYGQHLDGLLADINFVDGQALDASYFGEVAQSTGVWRPKRYTGTYGTNGYFLPFTNTTSLATLSGDASGNNNNWTSTNHSLTAGADYDSHTSTPSNNYPTIGSWVAGNCYTSVYFGGQSNNVGSYWYTTHANQSIPRTGKWYWEYIIKTQYTVVQNNAYFGIVPNHTTWNNNEHHIVGYLGSEPEIQQGYGMSVPYGQAHSKTNAGGFTTVGGAVYPASGDVMGCAFDADNGKIWWHLKGVWIEGNPATGTSPSFSSIPAGDWVPAFSTGVAYPGYIFVANFGQQPLAYTPPAGFKTLCTANIVEPYVKKPTKFFDVRTYTGNGTSPRAIISDLAFGPDITWVKRRNIANTSHALTARFAGAGNVVLSPDTNLGFVGTNGAMTSWDNNGVTVQTGSTDFAFYNTNASNYVAYNWYAGYWIDHNYVKNSEAMDASSWVKTLTTTVTPNTTVAPDGTTTADTINQGITNGGGIYQDFGFSPGNQPYCFSVYLKSTTSNQLTVVIYWLNSVVEAMQVSFNPLTGAYLNSWVVSGSPTNLGYSITDVGGGWYRVALYGTGATPANTFARPTVYNNGGSGTDYQMWGAMCNYGLGAGNYFPTGNSPAFRHKYPATGTGVSYYDHTNGTATATYHGLGVSPDFVFLKNRSTTGDWMVFHKDMGGTMGDTYMRFNSINGSATGGGCSVDASKVTVGSGYASATGHIHTFTSIEGFSKFGKYKGNGAVEGPYVFCGFRPAFVMIKRVDNTGYWYLFDSKRDPENVVDVELYANVNSVEATAAHLVDFTANGFKIRSDSTWTEGNASGGTYIYAAWAEAPFKYALAR